MLSELADHLIGLTVLGFFSGLCELYAAYAILTTSFTTASLRDLLLCACFILPPHTDLLRTAPSSRRLVVLGRIGSLDRRTLLPIHMVAEHKWLLRYVDISFFSQGH